MVAPMPSDGELLIRSAWLINYLTAQISNTAAQMAMMTTHPEPDPKLDMGLVEQAFGIMRTLRDLLAHLELDLDPRIGGTLLATLDVMQIRIEEFKEIAADVRLLKYMTEPELSAHLTKQLRFIKSCETQDTIGTMLVIFQQDGICQYGSTVQPANVPEALRELADRLERKETVTR